MTKAQKIIKYLALAFALFLIVIIFSIITMVLYSLTKGLTPAKNLTLENIQCKFENITSLDINIDYNNLEIRNSDNFNIQANNKNISCENNNKTLTIKEKENWFNFNYNHKIIIDIPNDFHLENLKLESGAGTVIIDSIFTDKIKLDLGAGKTEIASLVANNAVINIGIGKFQIKDGKIGNLNFDMGIGEANINSILFGLTTIDNGIGSLNLNLLDSIDSYKINVECLGNINVNSKKLENSQIGNGENTINIDNGIGTININYNE